MSTVRRCIGAAAVALAGGALAAAPATALEPGVHIDPGSPAAKEYALPLGQARQLGVQSYSSSSESKLFGAGIKRPGGGSGNHPGGGGHGSGGAAGGGSGGGSGGATTGSSSGAAGAGSLPASVVRAVHERASGGSSLLVLIGGGVAILVLGAFGGTVLRHRRPHLSP